MVISGRLSEIEEAKIQMTSRIEKFIISENMKPMDFTHKDRKGYIEYEPGLFIQNITSRIQEILGITMFHAFTTKNLVLDTHTHSIQSQTITVNKGKIFDEETGIMYKEKDSMFISRRHNHKVKYFENSEYIIYYAPNLSAY